MRETTLERVRLHWNCECGHKPRPVGELISQQPLHTFLVNGIFCRHVAGDMQGIKRFYRRISLARNPGKLAPTSLAVLRGLQSLHERGTLGCTGSRISQSVELHRSLFDGVSLGGKQPTFRVGNSVLELLT